MILIVEMLVVSIQNGYRTYVMVVNCDACKNML
jgi:hypothetical protein